MNAVPPPLMPGDRSGAAFNPGGTSASAVKWAAVQRAGEIVAALAGTEPERPSPEVLDFPAAMHAAAPWRRELADQAIGDLAAVMESGIAALLGVNARGADPRAAALALWREFTAARAAILALLPSTTVEPRRRA
jgi:hypothetical protein